LSIVIQLDEFANALLKRTMEVQSAAPPAMDRLHLNEAAFRLAPSPDAMALIMRSWPKAFAGGWTTPFCSSA